MGRGLDLSAILDTSVLIRHLTGEPPRKARQATRRLAEEQDLVLTDVVMAQCAQVLRAVYGLDRARIALLLRSAMALPAIVTPERELLELALFLYERQRVDFTDAYLSAVATRSGVRRVLSFDRDFDRLPAERVAP
jgi:predicted nucleic acid-binding protein